MVLGESHDKIRGMSSLIRNPAPTSEDNEKPTDSPRNNPDIQPSTSESRGLSGKVLIRKPRRTLGPKDLPGGDNVRASRPQLPGRSHSDGEASPGEDSDGEDASAERLGSSPSRRNRADQAAAHAAKGSHLSTRQQQELQYDSLKKQYGLAASEYINWRIKNKIPDGTRVFCMAGECSLHLSSPFRHN